MLRTLDDYDIGNQPVTFPARSIFVNNSVEQLQYLLLQSLEQRGTLTIWESGGNVPDMEQINDALDVLGRDKVYLDVPEEV